MLTDTEFQQEVLMPIDARGIAKIATYGQFQNVAKKLETHLSERRDTRAGAQHSATIRSLVSHLQQFQGTSSLPALVPFSLHKLIFSYYLKSKKKSHSKLTSLPDDPLEISRFYKELKHSGKLSDPYWHKSFFISFAPALRAVANNSLIADMVEMDAEAIQFLWELQDQRISRVLGECYFQMENGKATGIAEAFAPPPGAALNGAESLLACRFNTGSIDKKYLQTAPDFLSMVPPSMWASDAQAGVFINFPFEDIDSLKLKGRIAALCPGFVAESLKVDAQPAGEIQLVDLLRKGVQVPESISANLISSANEDDKQMSLVVMIAQPSFEDAQSLSSNWKLLTDDPRTAQSLLKMAANSNGGMGGDYIANKIPFIYKSTEPPIELASLYERKSSIQSIDVDMEKHEEFASRLLQNGNVSFVRGAMEFSQRGENYDMCKAYLRAYLDQVGVDDYAKVFCALLPSDTLSQTAKEAPEVAKWISSAIFKQASNLDINSFRCQKLVAAEIDQDLLESWALIREHDNDMRSLLSLVSLAESGVESKLSPEVSVEFGLDF